MKNIEKLKLILGLILISFAIIGGLVFFLESFGVSTKILEQSSLSMIFQNGITTYSRENIGGGASNVTIFLGLCGLAGSYLLVSVKSN